MSVAIVTEKICKNYRVYEKQPGIAAAVASLFKRKFEIKDALKDFSFEVQTGELVGLLGPNGAGKTTLMKLLTGLVVPSAGSAKVLGLTPHQRTASFCKNITIVMGNKSQLWWDLPAMDSFRLLQRYYEVDEAEFKKRLAVLSERLKATSFLQRHVRTLSLGERMKMELIACLLHDPKVIFLDEPTIGLDVESQLNIRDFFAEYHRENDCTIILTSHYMADIEALCERVVFVHAGEKRFDGTIDTFAGILGDSKLISLTFSEPIDTAAENLRAFQPQFNEAGTAVDLLIPRVEVADRVREFFSTYPVVDFQSEKLPIERVMASLMQNPELLSV